MENNNGTFRYTYSAEQQEEIRSIRKKYLPREPEGMDKMERLRRLDRSAAKKGTAVSILLGVVGCLLLGVGMCCTMVWTQHLFILGIAVVAAAYPLYIRITRREREKLAPQILQLTDELSKPE